MKVYGLSKGYSQDRRYDIALAAGDGHIIPAAQALAWGQSINLHPVRS